MTEQYRNAGVKATYRGWSGHHICGARCVFHLNTLLELGDCRVVVSTVGNFRPDYLRHPEEIHKVGADRYYETMAFVAVFRDGYWDIDVLKQVHLSGEWFVKALSLTSDAEAQTIHEAQVENIRVRMLAGETFGGETPE